VRSYVQRSLVYKHKGNLDQAHRDIVAALALNPSDAEAKALQEQLRSLMAATPTGKSESATTVATAQPQGTTIAKGAVPCVDEKGAWRNWPWANAPTLSPRCADVAPEPATQPASPLPGSSVQPTGPRLALVVGNGEYRFAPELANPLNDGRDIAAVLRELGFKVIEGYNLDGAGMRAKIAEFGSAMPGAATTLLFYAGHGIQVAGKNYLVPVDAKLERPSALGVEAIEVDTILADMETEKRTNLVFLDACRDNPLSRSLARSFGATRSSTVGQGLAQLNAGIGTLITFATSPNTVALDGSGRNSPFTAALLRHIRTPDIEIRTMLTRVRADVVKATNDRQLPWDHSSLLGEFYFKRGG
jgi:uncharacterized caspase-like protein